jgi:hypothetical protein
LPQKCYHIAMNLREWLSYWLDTWCYATESSHFTSLVISTQTQYDCTASSDHFVNNLFIYISHLQQPAKFTVKWTFLRSSNVRVCSRCFVKQLLVVNFVVRQLLVNNLSLHELQSTLVKFLVNNNAWIICYSIFPPFWTLLPVFQKKTFR